MDSSERIGLRIKLHELHVLLVVIEAGSMSKAARLLNTTQPGVSRSIGELENIVGVRLLDRHQKGIEPTAAGKALLEGGIAVFDDLRRAVNNVRNLSDPAAGEVRIGCTPILAAGFVSTVVGRLAQRHPRMVFHVITEYLEPLRRQLCDRSVDLLIVRSFSPRADEPLDFEFLSHDRYVVAVGRRTPLALKGKVDLNELATEAWTLPPPESVIGALARKAFRERGVEPPSPTVIANSPEVRISLLAAGRLVTIFPASILQRADVRSEIKVLPVDLPSSGAENVLVTLRGRSLSKVAEIFLESARHEAHGD
ncbi:LysR family transcriptional regulator [Alsobacter sp. SYSU BS001988]